MKKPINAVIGASLMALGVQAVAALDATWEYAVRVSAVSESSPPKIALSWPQDTQVRPTSYTVCRKSQNGASWGSGVVLPGTATGYVDTNITIGSAYEYQIVKATPTYTGYGYIYSGIKVPMIENRGKVILMVDNTYATELATELSRLEQDLAGDGWIVLRHDVARTETVPNVKARIMADYKSDPAGVRTLFLFGHLPVPYSGNIIPDGHYPDHQGAWPADAYYGDMDGEWTDSTVSSAIASDPRNRNAPGDGKFDQSQLPSPVELEVGRVDLANLPGRTSLNGPATFPSELELLRQYLNKDHNFRHGLLTAPRRAVLHDDFGFRGGEAFAASGYRTLAPLFGAENILTLTNRGEWMSTLAGDSFLWAYGCGAGSYTSMGGLGNTGQYNDGTTIELVRKDVKAVFTMVFGSWLGDWDSEDNIMRAVLATPTCGLTAAWSGRPHWFFHHMALGENIGYSTRLTQNNGPAGLYKTQVNSAAGQIHVALMGDPTLRMHVVAPPSGVVASGSTLSWTPSPEKVLGYHVYRAASPAARFTRLTDALLQETAFTDPTPSIDAPAYMVRAVKLENTASGSYFNPSQGAFATPSSRISVAHSAPANNAKMAVLAMSVPTIQLSAKASKTAVPDAAAPAKASKIPIPVNSSIVLSNRPPPTGDSTDVLWVDDDLPKGSVRGMDGGDDWNWVSSSPAPFSGTRASQSANLPGLHQHFFDWAEATLAINPGDKLYAYIYLNPNHPPSEAMLQWTDGTWEHRAYWGADKILYGVDGNPSRIYAGPLPPAGQWARLEVPANKVGLEGATIKGMAFSLFDGSAIWDSAGKSAAPVVFPATGAPPTNTFVWVDDALPSGAIPGTDGVDAWTWASNNPAPFSGARTSQSTVAPGLHQHVFSQATARLPVSTGDYLFTYVYLDPAHVPTELMLQWNDGTWEHRAYWGANNITYGVDGTATRRHMGSLPPAGHWTALVVPASQVGLEGASLTGMSFSLFDGSATWDYAGKSAQPLPAQSTVTNTLQSTTSNIVAVAPVTGTNVTSGNYAAPIQVNVADYLTPELPKAGDNTLHILSPTLLELKLINAKQPDPAKVGIWDWVNSSFQFTTPALSEFAVTVNGPRAAVQSSGFKRRPLYAPLVKRDLRIENCLFLQLANPIADGQTVEVKNRSGNLWPSSMGFSSTTDPLRFSPAIHVNQEGYVPAFPKKAIVGYYIGSLGEMELANGTGFKLVDATTGAEVFQGSLAARPDIGYTYTPAPYQKVLVADFTNFTTPGEYRLKVPGLGVAATTPTVSETGPLPGVFTFTRTGNTNTTMTVNYQFTGTAAKWANYRRIEGDMPESVTILAGAASATLTIYPVAGVALTGAETAILTLSPDPAYNLGQPKSATVTISENPL